MQESISTNNIKPMPKQQFQQLQQITRFDQHQHLPKIRHGTLKKFIPSPELIVDSSQSSSSESNEKFIIKNNFHGISVSGNPIRTQWKLMKSCKLILFFRFPPHLHIHAHAYASRTIFSIPVMGDAEKKTEQKEFNT